MFDFLWDSKKSILLRILLALAIGILVFINPTAVVKWLLYVIAGFLFIAGIIEVVAYFHTKNELRFFNFSFLGGILLILFSLIMVLRSANIANFLHIVMGVVVVISGANTLVQSLTMRKEQPGISRYMLIYALAIIILGGFIVFNPFAAQAILYRFFGGVMIIIGISDFIWYLRFRNVLR